MHRRKSSCFLIRYPATLSALHLKGRRFEKTLFCSFALTKTSFTSKSSEWVEFDSLCSCFEMAKAPTWISNNAKRISEEARKSFRLNWCTSKLSQSGFTLQAFQSLSLSRTAFSLQLTVTYGPQDNKAHNVRLSPPTFRLSSLNNHLLHQFSATFIIFHF